MARLKLIPLSRAKTAYGLVQEVKRAIIAEPKRAYMGTFAERVSPENGGPACGTVGCFAGWVCLLRGQYQPMDASIPASQILGGNRLYGGKIDFSFVPFGGSDPVCHVFNSGGGDGCATTAPGTRAHARAVVARINRFLKKNAAALKTVKLAPVAARISEADAV